MEPDQIDRDVREECIASIKRSISKIHQELRRIQ
jgi:hypothetical protein